MVQFYRQLLYIRGKSLGHKTKQPLFNLGISAFFQQKNGKLSCSIIFMSMQFYSILLHLNFSVLTVDRVSPLSGGRRKHHFREMRQPSAIPADDRDSAAAQLLGNGGKIEPYTIIYRPYAMLKAPVPSITVVKQH
jgi:hypothetical protein